MFWNSVFQYVGATLAAACPLPEGSFLAFDPPGGRVKSIFQTRSKSVWVLVVVLLPIFMGCGGGVTSVSGMVTLDGEALDNGAITFVPEDGNTPTAGAIIAEGKYHLELAPGEKRVEISATKVIGKRQVYEGAADSPVVDNVQEIIPPKYNTQSTLIVSIDQGENAHDFDLKSSQ